MLESKVSVEKRSLSDEEVDDQDDDDYDNSNPKKKQALYKNLGPTKCPYLDTINRQVLDLDSEKLCCVTLTNMRGGNVYACLVCGKFFAGRGRLTPAYTHSVSLGHFVFMNLRDGRAYCLPDGYEVRDSSLRDVQFCLSPVFTFREVGRLNYNTSLARDVFGVSYLPGFMGLNNLTCTDDLSVLLHALAHVSPFRDFWLQHPMDGAGPGQVSTLARQFGLVMRKMWSGGNFKSSVSPQELVQEISVASQKRFCAGQRSDCVELLTWLLRQLFVGLGTGSEVLNLTKQLVSGIHELQQQRNDSSNSSGGGEGNAEEDGGSEWKETLTTGLPFTVLSVDLPPCPLFRDSAGGLVIPQLPLFEVLRRKFDGHSFTDSVSKQAHVRRRYRITRLPRFLVLQLVRFTKNNFALEKNPTIITFPVKNLEMKDYLYRPSSSSSSGGEEEERERALRNCPSLWQVEHDESFDLAKLQEIVRKLGTRQMQRDLELTLKESSSSSNESSATSKDASESQGRQESVIDKVRSLAYAGRTLFFDCEIYDLVANICHDSSESSQSVDVGDVNMAAPASSSSLKGGGKKAAIGTGQGSVLSQGCYKIHIQNKATGQWYEMQDLHVRETTPQLIGISESYILVYEKKRVEG
eukprot:gene22889-31191_t